MTGIILLAAGESKRFGAPKQLAEIDGQTLLQRAAETALTAGMTAKIAEGIVYVAYAKGGTKVPVVVAGVGVK